MKDAAYFYVYVLLSEKDGNFYTGYTHDIEERLLNHNNGLVKSTKYRRPFHLIYFEACLSQQDATRREKYLKSGNGKIYVRNRLRHYFDPTG
jgi:putative endonuclease